MSEGENTIRGKSDVLLRIIKDKMGIELDYSMFSLLYFDKILEDLFGPGMSRIPEDMKDFRNALRLQIGCFYGECIRASLSGEWVQDENGLSLQKIGNQEVSIYPLSTAHDRMEGDDTKLFFTAKCVIAEVFKQVGVKIYGMESAKPPATPPPLPS